jgi:hypothetical protein
MPKLRNGHAPGHVRDTARDAFEAWLAWDDGPEPTVEYEIGYVPRLIPISQAMGLVWNCTDIVGGILFQGIQERIQSKSFAEECAVKRRTYAACARAVLAEIRDRREAA